MARKILAIYVCLCATLLFGAACARREQAPGNNQSAATKAPAADLAPNTLSPDEAALLGYAGKGDLKKVQELLGKGVNVNAQDTAGRTALIEAAYYGQTPMVKFLLEKGANPNARKKDGFTVLMAAGKRNEIRELLLKAGAKDYKPELLGPLMTAAIKGDLAKAKELVQQGADVNGRNADGGTPLIEAVYYNHPEIVKFLLESGADPNARKKDGATPLGFADKKPEIIEMLKKAGAK